MAPLFLIADDSPGKTMFLYELVTRWNPDITIITVETTDDAKQVIDSEDIACAFIDFEMPTELGPEVIRYLKEKRPNTRVAMVTSGCGPSYKDPAMEAGADAFICTSMQSDHVEKALKEVLAQWKESL